MSALACRYASEDIRTTLYNVAGRDQEEPASAFCWRCPVIGPRTKNPVPIVTFCSADQSRPGTQMLRCSSKRITARTIC